MTAITTRPFGVAGITLAILIFAHPTAAQQRSAPPLPDPATLSAS